MTTFGTFEDHFKIKLKHVMEPLICIILSTVGSKGGDFVFMLLWLARFKIWSSLGLTASHAI